MPAEANVKAGALLGFKVGLQADVDLMLAAGSSAGAQHGCFYLTKDSHRLYVGNEDSSLSAVNEGIQTVTWNQLSTIASTAAASAAGVAALTGRFYYASDQNILCVYNGQDWVRLNENDDTYVDGHTITVSTSNGVATITDTVENSSGQDHAATFSVTGDNGVTVSSTGTAITITGDTYTLSAATNSSNANDVDIKLDSSNTNNDSSVTLAAGDNVHLAKDANTNKITISSDDNYVSGVDVSAETTGFKFTVTNSGGSSEDDTIDPKISVFTSSDPTATASTSGATNSVSFVNGTATLDVYSRSAIDSKLKAVNAMTYRGTIGASGTAATSISYDSNTGETTITRNNTNVPVSIGDTFLSIQSFTYNGILYESGSLFIVRAKDNASEGSDGIIAVGDYICDVVAEVWDTDTTFILQGITSGIQLHSSTGIDVGSFVVTAGDNNDWISIAETETNVNGVDGAKNKTLTVTHKNVTRTNTTGTAQSQQEKSTLTIPVITNVTSDAKGHITGVETTNYTVLDTNASLKNMSTATSAYSTSGSGAYSAGVITTGTTLTDGIGNDDTESTSVVISSSSLTITDDDTRGTTSSGAAANGLKIEMAWGSF